MLWLFVLLIWSIGVACKGPEACRPAARVITWLLGILGFLHLVVTSIEAIQYVQRVMAFSQPDNH